MAPTDLDGGALRAIIEPFGLAEIGLSVTVETLDGRVLASAGNPLGSAAQPTASRDVTADGEVVGRVRAGGTVEGPLAAAIVAGIGASIEALIGASRRLADEAAARTGAEAERQRLAHELALACRIQRSFVPLIPPDVSGYELAGHYQAAAEIGGDFFDIFPVRRRPGRLAMTIADVSGKGVAAALLMAFARPLLHAAVDSYGTPVEALERTNAILVEEGRSSLFITALCVTVERRTGRVHLANAGHEPPLLVPGDGSPIRWLEEAGPLLGAFSRLGLVERLIQLSPGDLLLLYTDGVTDMRAPTGERFGDERMLDAVQAARGGSAAEVVAALSHACREFQGTASAADDVAIVAIRRSPRSRRRSTEA